MADEDEDGQEGKGKGSKKLIIIAAAAILVLGVAGGFFYMHHKKPAAGTEDRHLLTSKEMEKMIKDHPIIDLSPFVVNLSGPAGSAPQYLKVRIALKVDRAVTAKEVGYRMPEIQSSVLILLGAQTSDDIQTTGGKLALKEAIRHRINARLDSGKVTDVYFTEFVVQ